MPKKKKMSELTVKELRVKAIKLGLDKKDAEVFDKKAPLIATIKALDSKSPVSVPGQSKKDREKYLSKKEIMRKILMKEERVSILIPLTGKEKKGVIKLVYSKTSKREEQVLVSGAYTPVQINGFKWLVPHGVYNSVPMSISKQIGISQNAEVEAGKPFLTDRIDPKTGNPVSDRLD